MASLGMSMLAFWRGLLPTKGNAQEERALFPKMNFEVVVCHMVHNWSIKTEATVPHPASWLATLT